MQTKDPNLDAFGLDVSSLQTITNETLLFNSIDFLYARAYGSDHTGTGDSKFVDYCTRARAHGVPVGGYYFGTPYYDPNGMSLDWEIIEHAQDSAQQFVNKLETAFGAGNTGDLIPMLDVESYQDKYNQPNGKHTATMVNNYPQESGMTGDQLITWIKAFRDFFYQQTGRRCGIYAGRYFMTTTALANGLKEGMALTTAQMQQISDMPLWLAEYDEYTTGGSANNVTPPNLGGWDKYVAWQYTGLASASTYGLSHSANQVDANRSKDISWLLKPPLVESWGLTDNHDGTLTVTMTHPNVLDYIGTSVYQDNVWKKWISKTATSTTLTGLTLGTTYAIHLTTEDNYHDFTKTTDKSITLTAPVAEPEPLPPPPEPPPPPSVVDEGTTMTTPIAVRSFTFAGRASSDYFDIINKIERPFMPPIEVPSVKIPSRAGEISLLRNEVGIREINIEVTLLADSFTDLRTKVRNLATFLIFTADQDLIFSDEPNRKYKARFNSAKTDLEEVAYDGQGTLTFTCFDPWAYSTVENTQLIAGQQGIVTNGGTTRCYPRLEVTPTASCTLIKLKNLTTGNTVTFNATWPANSTLVVDMNTNRVYRKSDNVSQIINITLDSVFWPMYAGANTIRVENQDINGVGVLDTLRVYWTERFY